MDEAIAISNASRYGLGSSIWSKRQGKEIARQLHCGMVAINSTISFAAIASVPFGGVKDSGYGHIPRTRRNFGIYLSANGYSGAIPVANRFY